MGIYGVCMESVCVCGQCVWGLAAAVGNGYGLLAYAPVQWLPAQSKGSQSAWNEWLLFFASVE